MRGGFIHGLDHTRQVPEPRLRASFIVNQFDETNQTATPKCHGKNAAVEKGRFFPIYSLDILPVMGKPPPLPHGALVVNFPDAPHKVLIERYLPNRYSLLLRLASSIPRK